MKRNREDYIYIVLVRANTFLGKFARFFSKYQYTHIAVALDKKLNDFITFSRRKHYTPFDSGFMHETIDCYAYGKYDDVKLKVFKVPVSLENKDKINKFISKIENDKDYIFNIHSMATMSLIHGFRIYKAHNCMSFTAKILQLAGVKMKKKYYRYNIKDMDLLLSDYLYKEDYFKKDKIYNKDYMRRVNFFSNLGMFFKLNGKLIYRFWFKRRMIDDEE